MNYVNGGLLIIYYGNVGFDCIDIIENMLNDVLVLYFRFWKFIEVRSLKIEYESRWCVRCKDLGIIYWS